MDTPEGFKVSIRRKIPYLTNLFLVAAGLCFLVIIAFDLLFYPFKSAGQEAKAFLFYWLVPEVWKKVYIFSVFGLFATSLAYGFIRYYKTAILSFYEDKIVISGKSFNTIIPIKTIRRIFCNDATTLNGESKQKLSITIEQKRVRKVKARALAIRLKNYEEADGFMEELLKYEDVDLKFYNFAYNVTHMDEN
jgi:hypothetical protein